MIHSSGVLRDPTDRTVYSALGGVTETSMGYCSISVQGCQGAVPMPRPERKAVGGPWLLELQREAASLERLSLVEGCSQPTPMWSGQSRENEYPR